MPDESLELTITVDSERFTMDDLTFRERKELRKLARELDGNPEIELADVMFDDLLVAFATVCKRRTVADFSLDDALDIKAGDLLNVEVQPEAKKPRPTRAAAKAAE